jgi:hypothetical protein
MKKIGDSTNTATESGEWTEGNPGAGADATLLKADWLTTLQREIIGVIHGAGIPLNKEDDLQLFKAVSALAGAAADFRKLLNKPTTLGGYGITDVYTADYMDGLLRRYAVDGHTHTFSSLTGKPTTLGGYGITDVYTAQYMDELLRRYAVEGHTHAFSSLTGTPTTVNGYGITDVYTKAQANSAFASSGHSHSFSSLTGKPTTLGGYGITDVYTAGYMDGLLAQRVGADSITGAGFINGNQGAPYFRGTDGAIVRIAASAETHTVSTFMKPVAGQWISLNGSPAVLPAGGTWAYFKTDFNLDGSPYGGGGGIAAGGTTLTTSAYSVGFAWRIQ